MLPPSGEFVNTLSYTSNPIYYSYEMFTSKRERGVFFFSEWEMVVIGYVTSCSLPSGGQDKKL